MIIFFLITVQCSATHFVSKHEAQRYIRNMDTIVLTHSGTDRIVFNADTIYVKMQSPPIVNKITMEQKWVTEHPILFTLIIALLMVVAEVELFKLVLKR